jgi:hypothetical protein
MYQEYTSKTFDFHLAYMFCVLTLITIIYVVNNEVNIEKLLGFKIKSQQDVFGPQALAAEQMN